MIGYGLTSPFLWGESVRRQLTIIFLSLAAPYILLSIAYPPSLMVIVMAMVFSADGILGGKFEGLCLL